jgi:hypothetical protein
MADQSFVALNRVRKALRRIGRRRHVAQQAGFEFEFLPYRINRFDFGQRRQIQGRLPGTLVTARRARQLELFPGRMKAQHDERMMAVDVLPHGGNLPAFDLLDPTVMVEQEYYCSHESHAMAA